MTCTLETPLLEASLLEVSLLEKEWLVGLVYWDWLFEMPVVELPENKLLVWRLARVSRVLLWLLATSSLEDCPDDSKVDGDCVEDRSEVVWPKTDEEDIGTEL